MITLGFGSSVFARPSRLSRQLVPLLAPKMRVLLSEAWLPDGELRHEREPVGVRRPRCAAQMRNEDAIGFMAKARGCFIGLKMSFGRKNSIVFKVQSCLAPMRLRIALHANRPQFRLQSGCDVVTGSNSRSISVQRCFASDGKNKPSGRRALLRQETRRPAASSVSGMGRRHPLRALPASMRSLPFKRFRSMSLKSIYDGSAANSPS